MASATTRIRRALTVRGIVQGVGFRPFVYNTAVAESLSGWVENRADSVSIEIEGQADAIDRFLYRLRNEPPPAARLDEVHVSDLPSEEGAATNRSFQIFASQRLPNRRAPVVPPDLRVCPQCEQEVLAASERRHHYPFTNCTNCGPRWSIIEGLPYDRPRTSMRRFAICEACRSEYEDPTDRRFHAQPIACPKCGPRLAYFVAEDARTGSGDEAITQAAIAIRDGRIVAMKGLGGFQLLCDAHNEAAVRRLRRRKRRPDKPLAVAATIEEARRCCDINDHEAATLLSPAGPIVLLRRRGDCPIATSVAPQRAWLGVMAPTTPLHRLLLEAVGKSIVCTSGNLSEEPMATDDDEAAERLSGIADAFLTHDRPIIRPVDDSVVRVDDGRVRILRRARGYAPIPLGVPWNVDGVVAVGARMKNTVCVGVGDKLIVSPHIGDVDDARTFERHRQALEDLMAFYEVRPRVVVCDRHPDYESTRYAESLARRFGARVVRVQHHHAHVAACLAEHADTGPALGIAWDGLGLGDDGTLWGGEALVCDGPRYHRIGSLRPFRLFGGDRAAKDPRLPALGLLGQISRAVAERFARRWYGPLEAGQVLRGIASPCLTHATTSVGRLFDGVAAIVGLSNVSTYEGQAAIELETLAESADESSDGEAYRVPLYRGPVTLADWRPMVTRIVDDIDDGVSAPLVARKFHRSLARVAVGMARRADLQQVAVTGGCFHNRLLGAATRSALVSAGYEVLEHGQFPAGDGAIALGQAAIAAQQLEESAACA